MEAFWNTEYGQNLLSVEQTEFDKLLSSPDETFLEDLFDEEELLQQCSNKNSKLVTFLSQPHNLTKLVSYITRPWQQHIEQIIHDLKQREATQKDRPSGSNPNIRPPRSPLSKNGTTECASIIEEDESFDLENGNGNTNGDGDADTNNHNTQTSTTATTTQNESGSGSDTNTNASDISLVSDDDNNNTHTSDNTNSNDNDAAVKASDDVKEEQFDKDEQLNFSDDNDEDNDDKPKVENDATAMK